MRRLSAVCVPLVALAACGSSSAASTARSAGRSSAATCGPRSAPTLAASGHIRVYSLGGEVYGCATRTHRSYRLGAGTRTLREGRVGLVAVSGEVAAYALSRFGVDTGSAQVIVRNLANGRRLHAAAASTSVMVESFQTVESLVVTADGSVAWISQSNSVAGHRSLVQVWRADLRGRSLLDSGGSIGIRSLRRDGTVLRWRDGSAIRSATLR